MNLNYVFLITDKQNMPVINNNFLTKAISPIFIITLQTVTDI